MTNSYTMSNWMAYLILFLLVYGISWLISFGLKRAEKKQEQGKKKSGLRMLGGLVVFLFFMVVLLLLAVVRTYTAFASHELVATVECRRAYDFGRRSFELILTPIEKGFSGPERSFILKGEKWSLGGDILEWQPAMTLVGFKSMYRLTRVQSHYENAEDEMLEPVTAFPLVDDEESTFWRTLADVAVKMPLIKSVHKNFVSSFPYYGDTFEIYVTPSGYTMERIKKH